MPNPEVHIHQDCEIPDQDSGDSEMPEFHDDDDYFPMPDLHQMIKDFEGKEVTGDYNALPTLVEDSKDTIIWRL